MAKDKDKKFKRMDSLEFRFKEGDKEDLLSGVLRKMTLAAIRAGNRFQDDAEGNNHAIGPKAMLHKKEEIVKDPNESETKQENSLDPVPDTKNDSVSYEITRNPIFPLPRKRTSASTGEEESLLSQLARVLHKFAEVNEINTAKSRLSGGWTFSQASNANLISGFLCRLANDVREALKFRDPVFSETNEKQQSAKEQAELASARNDYAKYAAKKIHVEAKDHHRATPAGIIARVREKRIDGKLSDNIAKVDTLKLPKPPSLGRGGAAPAA